LAKFSQNKFLANAKNYAIINEEVCIMISLNFFMPNSAGENRHYQLFGLAHILWLVIPLIILIGLCFLVRLLKQKGYGKYNKYLIWGIAGAMILLRIVKYYIFKPFFWDETWKEIIPFELCTIMSFVFPFTVFPKADKLNTYIYPLGIIGGFVTIAYSEWIFNGYGLDFNKWESLIVHWLLVYLPYIRLANSEFRFRIQDYYRPLVALIILVIYAWIANTFITPGANHMFLVKNPLPMQIPGLHHLFTLGLMAIAIIFLLYAPFIKGKCLRKGQNQVKQ
jgi:uncharacterized membrane protein YwaF